MAGRIKVEAAPLRSEAPRSSGAPSERTVALSSDLSSPSSLQSPTAGSETGGENDDAAPDASAPSAPDASTSSAPRRARRVAAWTATVLACLLVLFALMVPNDLTRIEPGDFVRIP